MKIEVERRQDWTILTLQGDLDMDAGPAVYLQFERELLQGQRIFSSTWGGQACGQFRAGCPGAVL